MASVWRDLSIRAKQIHEGLKPGSQERHKCKRKWKCKRKEIYVWTIATSTQMQTQVQGPTQKMDKNSFSCACICASFFISHLWSGATQKQMQTQGKTNFTCFIHIRRLNYVLHVLHCCICYVYHSLNDKASLGICVWNQNMILIYVG